MVRQREVEESMELCMRFMMVSCEVVERKRVFKAVSPVSVIRFAEAWRRLADSGYNQPKSHLKTLPDIRI